MKPLFRSREAMAEALLDSAEGSVVDVGGNWPARAVRALAVLAVGVASVLLVWAAVAWLYNAHAASAMAFPTPAEAFARLWEFFATDYTVLGQSIAAHTAVSLGRWLKGFVLALVVGLTAGFAVGCSDRLYEFGMAPLNILQMIPGLAWYPVTILLFGFGEESCVFIIAVTVISPIAFNVAAGLRKVPAVSLRVARMCGKTRWETLTEVLVPFAALDILSGLRVGMANGWRMLIAAEMVVGVAVGLGYAIQISSGYLDYVSAFACIMIICAIGLAIDKVFFASLEAYTRRLLGMEEA